MERRLSSLRLEGARILRDGSLTDADLMVDGGRIGPVASALRRVDLSGYLILPGIVDMHGDAFERHIAPRPTAPFPIAMGLASVDRELSANGVTTAWLAQSWSWEGGLRGPDYAEGLCAALAEYRPRALADLRIQIRAETHMVDTRARLIDCVRRWGVDYVVFNDHLPEAMQMVTTAPHILAHWAEREGGTIEDFSARLRAARERGREVPRHLNALAAAFDDLGVIYGSHDDPDGETRDVFHALGARICEFPTRGAAASVAKAWGDWVVMGAPNVVRGGSQSGNVSAAALIQRGLCHVLVSDYHYPALPAAAWALADQGLKSFAEAWEMISSTPATVMKMTDRGRLEPGLRADLVVMNAETRVIEATIAGGRVTHMAGDVAARFAEPMEEARLAAE